MRTHFTAVVRACFAAIHQIRSVRQYLSRHALLTLVRALIVSKVDYCNSVLAGISGQLQDRLQSVSFSQWGRTHNPIASWAPLVASSVVPCWGPSPDIWCRHSTPSAFCWHIHAGHTTHQTFNTRWPCLPSGFSTCMEQPAVICQERTVAGDVSLRAEDCTFSVVVWQWLGDRDCTTLSNCCLPATTDCMHLSFLFVFVLILYGAPAMSDMIVSPLSVHSCITIGTNPYSWTLTASQSVRPRIPNPYPAGPWSKVKFLRTERIIFW